LKRVLLPFVVSALLLAMTADVDARRKRKKAPPKPEKATTADILIAAGAVPVDGPTEIVDSATLGVDTPILDPGGLALKHFHESLRATDRGEDKTRIAVFGASHMAGDMFTRVIRHRLQDRFGDAGPGFVVPAWPWRDYNHRDVNISYTKKRWDSFWVSRTRNRRDDDLYGMAGVAFSSNDKRATVEISTARRSRFGRSVNQIDVFYWKQRRGGDFYVTIDGKRRRVRTRSKEPGPAYATYVLEDAPHTIKIRPRGNGEVLLFGVALDRDVKGVVMDTMGINGARASAQLEWNPRLFADHLTRRDADLVVLAYGTNAVGDMDDPIEAYERRFDLVVNRVKSLLPEASCLIIGPSDRPVKVPPAARDDKLPMRFLKRPRQGQVIAVQKKISERYGCGFWDMAAASGGDLSFLTWVASEPRLSARDYVHFTRRGYERMADLFWKELMKGFDPPSSAESVARDAPQK
jgi:lysophospholipase L1-like esterase